MSSSSSEKLPADTTRAVPAAARSAARTSARVTDPATKKAPAKKAPAKKSADKPAADGNATATATKKAAAAKKTAAKKAADAAGAEQVVEEVVEVAVGADGSVVDAKAAKGGKLDDVDESEFQPEAEKTLEKELAEDEGFVISEADEADEPEQQVLVAGATADPVKDYLKQIGKVPLLNAEQEVELAKRIEAGLFAEEQLADEELKLKDKVRDEYEWIAEDGRRAKYHLLEANLRLVVS